MPEGGHLHIRYKQNGCVTTALYYSARVDQRLPLLVSGMKENDFTADFVNDVASGLLSCH